MNSASYLLFPWIHSFKQLRFAGVALRIVGDGFHIGVLHREDEGTVECLHLAGHLDLRNDLPRWVQAWIQLPYEDVRLQAIAGLCRLVSEKKQEMKYAFRFAESTITPTGDIIVGNTEYGFTCATFVLALFRAAVIELVDVVAWPPRADEDAKWQASMIQLIRDDPPKSVSREDIENHLRLLKSEIGCARFRPEEVAAAASRDEYPVHHETAWKLGNHIASTLRATA